MSSCLSVVGDLIGSLMSMQMPWGVPWGVVIVGFVTMPILLVVIKKIF